MKRPKLALAARPRRPSLSLAKKAIRLFKGRGVPREVYRRNALKWLAANAVLGDKHLLRGGEPRWGVPGEPGIQQVHAPRRLAGRA